MKIVVWAPEVTPHLTDTLVELQKMTNEPLLYMTWEVTHKVRMEQGWSDYEKTGGLNVIEFNHKKWWRQGVDIINLHKNAIHIFIGFWTVRCYFIFILFGLYKKNKIAILNEPFSTGYFGYSGDDSIIINWIKVKLRPLLYHLAAFLIDIFSNNNPPCFLSISLLAREQFLRS